MPTVVVGYVPKPEGEAALAASIAEARLRRPTWWSSTPTAPNHGDTEARPPSSSDVRGRVEAAGVVVDVRQPGPASSPPRTSSPSPTRSAPS